MADVRPRRARTRRVLPILAAVALTTIGSMAFGPALSAQRVTGPRHASLAPPSTAARLVRGGADPFHAVPAGGPATPVVSTIAIPPREPTGPSATAVTRAALQARLDQLRERYGIPGISVAIIFPDGTTWVGVSGVADVATKAPVTPSTAFAIASVTKTFTSALILALVEDGRIALDDRVRTYLPTLKINAKITVRQLLDHTSGLRDYFFHPAIDKALLADPERAWATGDALKYVGKPYFKPGDGWHYSNTNYLVLGMLAEAVGKAPLADQIRTRFLKPLGLAHTWYQPTETGPAHPARGYRFKTGAKDDPPIDLSDGTPVVPFTSVVTAAAGAGGLASSSSDLARWVRALYAGGVLKPESVEAMFADITQTERYKPTVPYGLGVQVVDIDGQRSLGHSGRLLGFRSAVRWLPDQEIAIAVLTNQSRTDPGIFVRALLVIAERDPICRVCAAQQ